MRFNLQTARGTGIQARYQTPTYLKMARGSSEGTLPTRVESANGCPFFVTAKNGWITQPVKFVGVLYFSYPFSVGRLTDLTDQFRLHVGPARRPPVL